jgi:hypothetical protein
MKKISMSGKGITPSKMIIRATQKSSFWIFERLSQILCKLQTVEQNIAKYLRAAAALARPYEGKTLL